jgi:hypothetical protein
VETAPSLSWRHRVRERAKWRWDNGQGLTLVWKSVLQPAILSETLSLGSSLSYIDLGKKWVDCWLQYSMPPPAKRRRKNDFQPSTKPVRSLGFFFNKRKKDATLSSKDDSINSDKGTAGNTPAPAPPVGESWTDEDIARHLQEEWNEQDPAQEEENYTEVPARVESIANSRDGQPNNYGARPEQLDRRVRDVLSGHIIPSTQDSLPIAPIFSRGKRAGWIFNGRWKTGLL